ncbi:MAG TPA: glycosyltransferase family 2 protein, partial [Anaerolineae bacterium]|nr:glycosyltransferase family 2 protein [Anaerolineae bacterium]
MQHLISVVIVNYNGVRWLERCLSSLGAQTYRSFEIILVDNASTDDSCTLVSKNFPNVILIKSATNVGFAAGNNLGIRAAKGDAIATLNTDTLVEADYLEKLSVPLYTSPRIGACAPLMLEMEHPDIVDAAGLRVDRFGLAWNIGAGQRAEWFQTGGEVYGACAGAALYQRAMLDEIGLFDDDYFGFYEDAD